MGITDEVKMTVEEKDKNTKERLVTLIIIAVLALGSEIHEIAKSLKQDKQPQSEKIIIDGRTYNLVPDD